mmetsp:Transcript_16115/g.47009  ORF Transcript_16115/g.47009 Transcript_16115/m.47009 type:complete len:202 (-) Transcript_16115:434-1039(-)
MVRSVEQQGIGGAAGGRVLAPGTGGLDLLPQRVEAVVRRGVDHAVVGARPHRPRVHHPRVRQRCPHLFTDLVPARVGDGDGDTAAEDEHVRLLVRVPGRRQCRGGLRAPRARQPPLRYLSVPGRGSGVRDIGVCGCGLFAGGRPRALLLAKGDREPLALPQVQAPGAGARRAVVAPADHVEKALARDDEAVVRPGRGLDGA